MPSTRTAPILQIDELWFAHPGEPPLFDHWSASILPGVNLLYGDTGAGKSTLLQLLSGRAPVKGRLQLGDVTLDADPDAYRQAVFWRSPEDETANGLLPQDFATTLCAGAGPLDSSAWLAHAEGFSLGPHLAKPMYALSTGSRRKVVLATALAASFRLTLLDEPTGGLDRPSIVYWSKALEAKTTLADRAILIASGERLTLPGLAGVIELPV